MDDSSQGQQQQRPPPGKPRKEKKGVKTLRKFGGKAAKSLRERAQAATSRSSSHSSDRSNVDGIALPEASPSIAGSGGGGSSSGGGGSFIGSTSNVDTSSGSAGQGIYMALPAAVSGGRTPPDSGVGVRSLPPLPSPISSPQHTIQISSPAGGSSEISAVRRVPRRSMYAMQANVEKLGRAVDYFESDLHKLGKAFKNESEWLCSSGDKSVRPEVARNFALHSVNMAGPAAFAMAVSSDPVASSASWLAPSSEGDDANGTGDAMLDDRLATLGLLLGRLAEMQQELVDVRQQCATLLVGAGTALKSSSKTGPLPQSKQAKLKWSRSKQAYEKASQKLQASRDKVGKEESIAELESAAFRSRDEFQKSELFASQALRSAVESTEVSVLTGVFTALHAQRHQHALSLAKIDTLLPAVTDRLQVVGGESIVAALQSQHASEREHARHSARPASVMIRPQSAVTNTTTAEEGVLDISDLRDPDYDANGSVFAPLRSLTLDSIDANTSVFSATTESVLDTSELGDNSRMIAKLDAIEFRALEPSLFEDTAGDPRFPVDVSRDLLRAVVETPPRTIWSRGGPPPKIEIGFREPSKATPSLPNDSLPEGRRDATKWVTADKPVTRRLADDAVEVIAKRSSPLPQPPRGKEVAAASPTRNSDPSDEQTLQEDFVFEDEDDALTDMLGNFPSSFHQDDLAGDSLTPSGSASSYSDEDEVAVPETVVAVPRVLPSVPNTSLPAKTIHVRAVFGFDARDETELSLRVGDIVRVLEAPADEGWWLGTVDGAKGLFPVPYTEPVPE